MPLFFSYIDLPPALIEILVGQASVMSVHNLQILIFFGAINHTTGNLLVLVVPLLAIAFDVLAIWALVKECAYLILLIFWLIKALIAFIVYWITCKRYNILNPQ